VHSAQIAFPGGKYENEDIDFASTALRETYEEVGVDPHKVVLIRPFTQVYIPPSNFMVYPYLGICKEEITFIPDPSEVAGIIELPIATFLSDTIIIEKELQTSYANSIKVPAFEIENHIVWGATAMMLSELKDVLAITSVS
jgi:8-oxo-dGTP pyrophosphatase MutT (NUDIX family)